MAAPIVAMTPGSFINLYADGDDDPDLLCPVPGSTFQNSQEYDVDDDDAGVNASFVMSGTAASTATTSSGTVAGAGFGIGTDLNEQIDGIVNQGAVGWTPAEAVGAYSSDANSNPTAMTWTIADSNGTPGATAVITSTFQIHYNANIVSQASPITIAAGLTFQSNQMTVTLNPAQGPGGLTVWDNTQGAQSSGGGGVAVPFGGPGENGPVSSPGGPGPTLVYSDPGAGTFLDWPTAPDQTSFSFTYQTTQTVTLPYVENVQYNSSVLFQYTGPATIGETKALPDLQWTFTVSAS
jgi:hypothetical protein